VQTTQFEYTDLKGSACTLIFRKPDFVHNRRVRARVRFMQAQWESTELWKRQEAFKKERYSAWEALPEEERESTPKPNGFLTDAECRRLGGGCPEEEFQLESEIGSLTVIETMRLIHGFKVDGVDDSRSSDELREAFSYEQPAFLAMLMTAAFPTVFDLPTDKDKESETQHEAEESR